MKHTIRDSSGQPWMHICGHCVTIAEHNQISRILVLLSYICFYKLAPQVVKNGLNLFWSSLLIVKFICSEKARKLEEIFLLVLTLHQKLRGKFLQKNLDFSKNINFMYSVLSRDFLLCKNVSQISRQNTTA